MNQQKDEARQKMDRQAFESLPALNTKRLTQPDRERREGKPEITKDQFSGDNTPALCNSVQPDGLNHLWTTEQECEEGPASEDQCPFAEGVTLGCIGWHTRFRSPI